MELCFFQVSKKDLFHFINFARSFKAHQLIINYFILKKIKVVLKSKYFWKAKEKEA